MPSIMDLARPRQPFALYERRGSGQLLFDMGIAGDFIGNLTQNNVQQAQGGTFPGLENYFFPREIELSLFGQIDPYARAEVRIEAGQESRGQEISVSLAEANLTLMALPFNTQAKLGMMRNRFGLTNQIHDHDLPFIDRPDVLVQFFGQDGLVEKGGEATWVPPLPFYLELLGGLFNGDNETAFGLGNIKYPLVTGRARTFFELEDLGALQLGMSVANGLAGRPAEQSDPRLGSQVQVRARGLAASAAHRGRRGALSDAQSRSRPARRSPRQTLNRVGWYAYGELQPIPLRLAQPVLRGLPL